MRSAVKSALKAGDEIARLIARLGTAEHPNGAILSAYRSVQRGVSAALAVDPGFQRNMAIQDALFGLRNAVQQTARESLQAAVATGQKQAARQAKAWGLAQRIAAAVDTTGMEQAWLGMVDQQITTAKTLLLTGAEVGEIVGDAERAGVLRAAPIITEGARWIAGAVTTAMLATLTGAVGQQAGWKHQAVAAIDDRTTDCCLRVNGQIQPLDKPFQLDGTPRFASEQMHPPFHWNCRSSEVLLPPNAGDDALTQQMQDAGQAELAARGPEGKNRAEIYPAHARSRR